MISPSHGELSPARFVILGNKEGPALILIGLENPQALDPVTEMAPPLRPTFTSIVSLFGLPIICQPVGNNQKNKSTSCEEIE